MKTAIRISALITVILVGALLGGCGADPDKTLQTVVDQFNETTPMMVDDQTRLDSAELLENRTMRMNYTLTSYASTDFDESMITAMEEAMKPQVLEQIRSNAGLAIFKDYSVTFEYAVRGSDDVELYVISITPEDYT
ncbi:MAG: hypothetical protein LBG99_09420 [Propionibacteriaceae bacterium]|jgi:hypothetical protein|nr:hypothetical protein [Propionibacteriaceae bacterium]